MFSNKHLLSDEEVYKMKEYCEENKSFDRDELIMEILAEQHDELEVSIQNTATEIEGLLVSLKEKCQIEQEQIQNYIKNTEAFCNRFGFEDESKNVVKHKLDLLEEIILELQETDEMLEDCIVNNHSDDETFDIIRVVNDVEDMLIEAIHAK